MRLPVSGFKMARRGVSQRLFEVFVSRVPWNVVENEIKEYFAQFGHVKKCFLPFNKETGFHKNYCWVGFSTTEGLNNALQKDCHMLEGVQLEVKLANRSTNKVTESDGRIADNG